MSHPSNPRQWTAADHTARSPRPRTPTACVCARGSPSPPSPADLRLARESGRTSLPTHRHSATLPSVPGHGTPQPCGGISDDTHTVTGLSPLLRPSAKSAGTIWNCMHPARWPYIASPNPTLSYGVIGILCRWHNEREIDREPWTVNFVCNRFLAGERLEVCIFFSKKTVGHFQKNYSFARTEVVAKGYL